MTMIDAVAKSVLLVLPFQSFIVVFLYNEKQKESFVNKTFLSWSILLLINIIGFFVFGIRNETDSIAGTVTFPFLGDFNSGACLVAMLNLMVLVFMKKALKDPLKLTYLISYFVLNLALLYYINSRLSWMIFIGVFLLFVFNASRKFRGVFLVSVFALPLLLNMGVLIYRILSLPVFLTIGRRIDLIDVTTFNGKSFLWQRTLDWLIFDQRGIVFGNGADGHHSLQLIPDMARKWFPMEDSLHLHSTVLMTLVDQGIFGFVLLLVACYRMYLYFRAEYQKDSTDAVFFAAVVFLIFVIQVDSFAYLGTLGYTILGLLIARASVALK
jgi:O-antigen ligase